MGEVKEDYDVFFEDVEKFMQEAEIHKRRGNNDFNPYLEMLSAGDEVKLHSALLCGFLNPQGNHYQGDVFLKTFLNIINLEKWFGDTSDARCYREYGHIDMYITNGIKHIIVENKIWAGDQKEQIQRYIEAITNKEDSDEEESAVYEDIAVLYLAPQLNKDNKRMPSEYSLGKWKIKGDYLEDDKGNEVRFKAISYNEEILQWIDASQKEVGCITSLNAALSFYKDVVQIITNTKEDTMSIAKFLTKDPEKMTERMEIVLDIFDKKEEILKVYFEAVIKNIKDEIEAKGFEIIFDVEDTWDNDKRVWKYPYVIKPKDCEKHYLAFCIEYRPSGNKYAGYGVRLFWGHLDSSKLKRGEKIPEYLGDMMIHAWWYTREKPIPRVEAELKKFLNDDKIKNLNDKLKSYQP